MKIALDCRCLGPEPTGIGRYTAELVSGLARDRRDSVWAVVQADRSGNLPPGVEPIPAPYDFESHLGGDPWRQLRLPRELAGRGIEVFHDPAGRIPWRSGGAGLAATIHDLALHRFPETNRWRYRVYNRAMVRLAAARADLLLADSEFVRGELLAMFGLPPKRVVTAPPGVRRPDPPPAPPGPDELAALGIDRPYVLAVAVNEPRKNLARLLDAWGRLTPELAESHRLVLAGPAGWRREAFAAALARLPAARRPVTAGRLPEPLLWRFYAGARVFVMPSLYEGFGLPVLEAMAAGCPVLAARAASLPEVAGTAADFFDPRDPDELAGALARLLADGRRRAALAAAGRARAAEFPWERTVAVVRAAYETIAGGRGRG